MSHIFVFVLAASSSVSCFLPCGEGAQWYNLGLKLPCLAYHRTISVMYAKMLALPRSSTTQCQPLPPVTLTLMLSWPKKSPEAWENEAGEVQLVRMSLIIPFFNGMIHGFLSSQTTLTSRSKMFHENVSWSPLMTNVLSDANLEKVKCYIICRYYILY